MISQEYIKKFLEKMKHRDFVKCFELWFNHRKDITKLTGIDSSAFGRILQISATMKYGHYTWMIEYSQAGGSSEPRERGWKCELLDGTSYGKGMIDMVTLYGRAKRAIEREHKAKKENSTWLLG